MTTRIGQPYTAGSWLVLAGSEEEFVTAWTEFTAWSLEHARAAESFVLIRNTDDPRRFLSFGAWADSDGVAAWRGSDEFGERLGKCRALCEEFVAHDYMAAAAQERGQSS